MQFLGTSIKKLRDKQAGDLKNYRFIGAPGAIPTRDLPLRRRTLYATELREQILSAGTKYQIH
jgi:hypothetical protein